MTYRGIMIRGGVEIWSMETNDALKLLMASNDEMGRRRQDRNRPCDGGTIFKDGVATLVLKNEHWVAAK